MERELKLGPLNLDPEHERKLAVIGSFVTIALGLAYVLARKKASAVDTTQQNAIQPSGSGGGGGAGGSAQGMDPVAAQLDATKLAINHSATYDFGFNSNAVSHDAGSHGTQGSGSGGIKIGPITIGGGGSKSGQDTWDRLLTETYNQTVHGANLSEAEFQLLIQQGGQLAQLQALQQTRLIHAAPPAVGPGGVTLAQRVNR